MDVTGNKENVQTQPVQISTPTNKRCTSNDLAKEILKEATESKHKSVGCVQKSAKNSRQNTPSYETPLQFLKVNTGNRISRTEFRKLRHSNKDLERELAARKEYENRMEQKLSQLTDACVSRAKDRNLRKSIHSVSSAMFLILFGFLLYCNYVMFAPHLNAIVMAILLSSVLNNVHESVSQQLACFQDYIELRIRPVEDFLFRFMNKARGIAAGTQHTGATLYRHGFIATALLAALLTPLTEASGVWYAFAALGKGMSVTVLGGVLLCTAVESRHLAAGLLTLVVVALVCFPMGYVLRACLLEAELLAKLLVKLLESDLDEVVARVAMHPALLNAKEVAATWGVELNEGNFMDSSMEVEHRKWAEWIKETLVSVAGQYVNVFSSSLLSILTNFTNMLWAFTTFSSTLMYLMQSQGPWQALEHLSPLSPEDNEEIRISITRSSTRIFMCSACVGLSHALAAYSALCLSSFPTPTIVALASGLMAVMPLVGTYMVSVPVALYLWLQGESIQAGMYLALEMVCLLWLDAWLYSKIPGHSYYVGLSIVFGMYQFGWFGFVLGPLIIGLTITVISIYAKYLRKPLMQDFITASPVCFGDERLSASESEEGEELGTGVHHKLRLQESPFQSAHVNSGRVGRRKSVLRETLLNRSGRLSTRNKKNIPMRSLRFSPKVTST